jgi:peptidoglycan hydrolase CwlO-like protein
MSNQQLEEKLRRLYKKLTQLEGEYDSTEDFEDIAHLDQQIEELVDEISEIEEKLDADYR